MANKFSDDYQENAFWIWYNGGRLVYSKLVSLLPPNDQGEKPSRKLITDWRNNNDWYERADEMDNEARKHLRAQAISNKAEMYSRHAEQAKTMLEKAYEYLENNEWNFKNPREALKAIQIGTTIERESRGVSDAIIKAANASNDSIEEKIYKLLENANPEDLDKVIEVMPERNVDDESVIDAEEIDG